MTHAIRTIAAGCGLAVAGCGVETNIYEELGEPVAATAETGVELPPIQVREGIRRREAGRHV